jgi:ankyrin repeat protein
MTDQFPSKWNHNPPSAVSLHLQSSDTNPLLSQDRIVSYIDYRNIASCSLKERMNRIDYELIQAAIENNLPEFSRLLSVGADVNATTEGGWTPLHVACYKGHLAVVIELLSPTDSNGTTTDILGKRKSRTGANIEAKDNEGNTPLHLAGLRGHLPVVKALLAVGADILAVNNQGELPIHLAVREGNSAVAKYLLQDIYATTHHLPLHELVQDLTWIGSPDSRVAQPLREVLDRNVLGTDDVVEIIEYLVGQNPALLSSRDQDGSLPLHVACRRGVSFAIVQSLVNLNKASVKSVTPQGDLPLFLACEIPETSLDTIFILLKLYPDLIFR